MTINVYITKELIPFLSVNSDMLNIVILKMIDELFLNVATAVVIIGLQM